MQYSGLDAVLAFKRELDVPYHAIEDVQVGLDDAPSTWTFLRLGLSDPITGTRKGHFRTGGTRYFLDLRRPARALVLRLKPGYHADVVAIEVDHAESLADAIRARIRAQETSTFTQPSSTTTGNASTGT
ncbi:MAG TPA: hypothetical protein VFP31_06225 [Gaiellaceae bacterium]|nr:hypothetical protein [Gaiellaceae bacterium]